MRKHVNDLLCCGATPLYLSAGFILEEGLPIETLKQIVQTMRKAAGKGALSHAGMLAKFQQSLGAKVYDRKSDKSQTIDQSSTAADSLHH